MESKTQQVKRLFINGITEIKFHNICWRWLIKNYSNTDMFVSFVPNVDPDTSIKISAGMGQVCEINQKYEGYGSEQTNTVYISGMGEVEVQQLWF